MCLRPDIVFVTTQAVYDDLAAVVKTGLDGDTVGFDNHLTALIKATEEDNEERATHWRKVQDFGTRLFCSPYSGIEIDGKITREFGFNDTDFGVEPEEMIKVYIGNPLNPPHEHQQPKITVESMTAINAEYLQNLQKTGEIKD